MRKFNITVNGTAYEVEVEEVGGVSVAAPVAAAPVAAPVAAPAAAAPVAAGAGEAVKSPMPGNIIDVKVAVGDKVTSGQVLLILEAMKMENEVVAPVDGTITGVSVQKGASVNSGDVLVTIG